MLGTVGRHLISAYQVVSSWLRVVKRRRQGFENRLRLGIVSHLMIASIGVGALVIVANFLVEQGVLIEKTTQVTRAAPNLDAHRAQHSVIPDSNQNASNALINATNGFARAVQNRISADTRPVQAEYTRSNTDFSRAVAAFIAQPGLISAIPLDKLMSELKAYTTHGKDLVLMADTGRAALNDYSKTLDELSRRLDAALQGAWQIFGRVIARRSLLELRTDINHLQLSYSQFRTAASVDKPSVQALLNAERALEQALDKNKRGFSRAYGDRWFTSMHDGVARLAASRTSLLQLDKSLSAGAQDLPKEAARIAATVAKSAEAPTITDAITNMNIATSAIRSPASNVLRESQPDATVIVAPTLITRSVVTPLPADHERRVRVAWISVGALGLLVFISVGTVLSIVRPVRRLLNATARLKAGESEVRVPRGGIKELDTLAVAFNAMADELSLAKAATRDHQLELEAKVALRTHQLKDLAEHDPLTGLANRRELYVLLAAGIERARTSGLLMGVFFLDIDNFKYMNDSMGHAFGDRVLMGLAQRLQEATRGFGFAARLGGDEFTFVLERAERIEDISMAGLSVVQAFQKPLSVDGRDLIVSVSIGASVYPDHGPDANALLKAADAALFRAKSLGRSQLSVFTPDLLEVAAAKFNTEQGLRRAIEKGEFELVFQPEVRVDTLETALLEALIRWRLPDGTLVSPGRFLAVAEESDLIMEISDWVLRSAIEAASHWYHGAWQDVRVAINVSPRQLLDSRFDERLRELLQEFDVPTRCIEIELTESVLQTGPTTIDALKRLRAHGVAIALDDFGTGYSSLASLEQLPLTRVKLDRSLIADIDSNPRSAEFVRAIILMCQALGLEITAEGIERPEQFALLLVHRSMYLQGFLLAHPVSRDEVLPEMARAARRSQALFVRSSEVDLAKQDQVAERLLLQAF